MEPVSKPWRIEMLGGLRILRDGREPIELLPQQPNALLAYLALHLQRAHAREELIERLWPEEEAGEAIQKKMRNTLHLLRRRFEQPPFERADLLQITRQTLGLDPALVSTDVQDFKDALSHAAATTDLKQRQQHLAEAVALYRGDLLPGFYQDCFLSERNRLADLYASALHLLTQVYEQAGDLEQAVESARRTVALDPLMEEAHCTLMRLFAEMGQPSAVLKQYQELEKILKEAFGEGPSPATHQLMETLRERAQANVPHTVNGNNGKPGSMTLAGIETPQVSRPAAAAALPETSPEPVLASLPTRPARTSARRPLLLGAIGVLVLLAVLGPRFLHDRAASPKPGLFVPDAQRLWVVHYLPAPDEIANSEPTAMTTDAAGNIYITGFTRTLHNDVDFLTLKYDPNGHLLWRARYNGPGNDVDRARSIAVDKDGNVYVTGDSDNGKGNGLTRLSGLDWATIKYGPDGKPSPTWPDMGFGVGVRRYNDPDDGEDVPRKLCVDGQGNVYVAGYAVVRRRRGGDTVAVPRWMLIKYDPTGKQAWVQQEQPSQEWLASTAADMVLDPAGIIYVTGSFNAVQSFSVKGEGMTVKYSPDGERLWTRTYPGNGLGDDSLHRIALDGSGNVYVAGEQYDGDLMNNGTLDDLVILKYDPDSGDRKWVRVYDNGRQEDMLQALTVDVAGEVCVVGSTGPRRQYLSVRYDANGNMLWDRMYDGTAKTNSVASNVAMDRAGNVIVTGHATAVVTNGHDGTASGSTWKVDNVTIKYDPAGHALWKGICSRAISWDADPGILAIDNNNCVIVTDQLAQEDNIPIITILKYAP